MEVGQFGFLLEGNYKGWLVQREYNPIDCWNIKIFDEFGGTRDRYCGRSDVGVLILKERQS